MSPPPSMISGHQYLIQVRGKGASLPEAETEFFFYAGHSFDFSQKEPEGSDSFMFVHRGRARKIFVGGSERV